MQKKETILKSIRLMMQLHKRFLKILRFIKWESAPEENGGT